MQLRLSHKIFSISGVGIIGLLALGGMYLFSDATQSVFRNAHDEARTIEKSQIQAQVSLLEIRRAEKDFLLRKDEKYVAAHDALSKKVTDLLDQMQRLPGVAGDLRQKLDVIQSGYATYQKHFSALSAAKIKLGLTEEAGLEGSLRKSVHEIEAALQTFGAPKLTITMLTMRRNEKDFMARGEPKTLDEMKKHAAEFSAELSASDLSSEAKADLAQKLSVYQHDFQAWAATAGVVADEQKGASAAFAEIEPAIDAVEKIVRTESERATAAEASSRDATRLEMEVAIAVIAACAGLLGFFISRSVSRPLSSMVGAMTNLSAGDMRTEIPGVGRQDEIGEMASAVQLFKDEMIEADRLRGERAEVEQRPPRSARST